MSKRPADWYDVQIDLGVIGDAFQILMRRWKEYLLLGFLMIAVSSVFILLGYVGFFAMMLSNIQPSIATLIGLYGGMLGAIIAGMALAYPFMFGIVSFTIREVHYGDATLADAWKPLRRFGRFAMAGLSLAVIQMIASILGCGIGGIVVGGLLMYVMPIMVHEELSFSDAVNESYARVKGQWLMAAALYFVAYIVASLGQVACGVGILLTYPLMFIIPTMHYLRHLPTPSAPPSGSQEHSPYPRHGMTGYGAPHMQQGIGADPLKPDEERPRPPVEEPPPREE